MSDEKQGSEIRDQRSATPVSKDRSPGTPAGTRDKGPGTKNQGVEPTEGTRPAGKVTAPAPLERAELAYENPGFLNSADGRLIRIVSEYMEPLARFRREQIQDTVVFFGSARFRGREEADHALELLDNTGSSRLAPSEEQPASNLEIAAGKATELQRKRAVAAVEMARYYEDARRLSGLLTQWAKGIPSRRHRFVVTSGGDRALWKRPTGAHTRPAARPSG